MSPKAKMAQTTKNKTRSSRAGLRLPVGKIHTILKNGKFTRRVGVGAAIYLAAVVEYLVAEILDLAFEVVERNKKARVKPRDLLYAIRNDEELSRMLAGATITQGGVMPSINPMLLPKKTVKASKNDDSESQASHKSQQY